VGAFLPETEHVAGGVTERRDPQVSFGVGSLDDLSTESDGVPFSCSLNIRPPTGMAVVSHRTTFDGKAARR
jgi:hypothetical protein